MAHHKESKIQILRSSGFQLRAFSGLYVVIGRLDLDSGILWFPCLKSGWDMAPYFVNINIGWDFLGFPKSGE